ncbi:response regulator [Pseudomonas matsuisoli]|jgi:DNA-binding NtrC family response regulator|uniref:Response regulator n=1 Tax=Pseudomonas matsuisoli TaxID=1515666 RepID=A0A917Q2N4_9PSED|nr:response regulator [Pseudomonas matsuisoli]GGK08682.1 response regulator [Pseudomonas matsuisoli]
MLPTQVIVIDDEPALADLMSELIAVAGAQPVAFETADAALLYLEKHATETSLVVTDVRMPGLLDGYDLAKLIFKTWPELPVILTSGYTSLNPVNLPDNAEFLPKPWPADTFLDTLKRFLN